MEIEDLFIFQRAPDYPITPKEHGTAFLMEHRHLWLRSSRQQAILKIRHEVSRSIRDFLNDRGFIELAAPILTGAACEGTSTLFETQYFDLGPAYLSQSGQLYMEAGAMAFGKVYCFGPAFRAEKSKTRRHLTEFWMVEPEMAFAQLEELMELVEEMVCFLVTRLLSTRREELHQLEREVGPLEKIARPFPRLTYQEALNTLRDKGTAVTFGEDLGADDETELSRCYDQPLFIHRYPAACKAFYMKRDPLDDRLVLNMDLLAPEGYGEVVGGSQREEDPFAPVPATGRTRTFGNGSGLVSGSSPLRLGPARRVRDGSGTDGGLALRFETCPGNHSLPPNPLSDLSLAKNFGNFWLK